MERTAPTGPPQGFRGHGTHDDGRDGGAAHDARHDGPGRRGGPASVNGVAAFAAYLQGVTMYARGSAKQIPATWEQARIFLGKRDARNVAGLRATRVERDGDAFALRYHATVVARWHREGVAVRNGGWITMTTRERVNVALRATGARVFRKNFAWFLYEPGADAPIPFANIAERIIPYGNIEV